ncbi:MAG: hypothetical protein US54_C0064G0003 [Candidatus Roizmanbacteria bacterium GW2011_GWA2_37_7]|uniref:Uncharacterized protein n=1 Tax=Candidatus Roizmanbacteria bacterium GW2011_GWA2_37_7 TaxID=1618481 RepID=A0A0G0HDA0_9BACT|nr:MAG: hypothetical protein US54_C0064G0003 [Candidatus Roizmanbacteria bacterium GW2011_GWA2_37_7]
MGEQLLSDPTKTTPVAELGGILDKLHTASSEGLVPPETREIEKLHAQAVAKFAKGLAQEDGPMDPYDRAREAALRDLQALWRAQSDALRKWMETNQTKLGDLPKLTQKFDTTFGSQLTNQRLFTFNALIDAGMLAPGNDFLFGVVGDEDDTPFVKVGNAHRFLIPTLAQTLLLTSENPDAYQELRAQTQGMVDAIGATASGQWVLPHQMKGMTGEQIIRSVYGDEIQAIGDSPTSNKPRVLLFPRTQLPTPAHMATQVYGFKPTNEDIIGGIFVPNAMGIGSSADSADKMHYWAKPIDHSPEPAAYPF